MDLYCPRCSEPWENDCLHEEAEARGTTYREVARDFRATGCEALSTAYGRQSCEPVKSDRAFAAQAMYDLLGDDMDGAAAMLEDFESGCY